MSFNEGCVGKLARPLGCLRPPFPRTLLVCQTRPVFSRGETRRLAERAARLRSSRVRQLSLVRSRAILANLSE